MFKKSAVEATVLFNSESKTISTQELTRLELNSCVAIRKPPVKLIRKKGFNLLGSIKIRLKD